MNYKQLLPPPDLGCNHPKRLAFCIKPFSANWLVGLLILSFSLLSSCVSDGEPSFPDLSASELSRLQGYYSASCRLSDCSEDSIASFSRSYADFSDARPAVRQHELHPAIVANISDAMHGSLHISVEGDGEWKDQIVFEF